MYFYTGLKRISRWNFLTKFLLITLLATACSAPILVRNVAEDDNNALSTSTSVPSVPTEPAAVAESVISETSAITQVVLPTVTPRPARPVVVPPDDEASERLRVPAGFAVRIFASDLNDPRLMDVGVDGHLYVAERGASAVIRLADEDGDGLADKRMVVASKLNRPHSVEWYEGALYVAEGDQIIKLVDRNGDGDMQDADEKTIITENIPSGGGHSSRTLHIGPDGNLYVAAGSTSNIEPESDARRAAISRFALDGSVPADNPFADDSDARRQVVWAEGLRNSVDFVFMPDGRLWANHNGMDGLGDAIPPEEIVIDVEKGKHYGWPYCYTPTMGVTPAGTVDVRDTRLEMDGPLEDCSQSTPALFTVAAHQAPLGMTLYAATAFPLDYQGNLFVAFHGSWDSNVARDCNVTMIVVNQGKPVEALPFLSGFRKDEKQSCGSAWGRPAGVTVGANGELFVSDDENGNVYRVVYVGE